MRRRRASRGQAAVEMALILPLLFLLVLGAADFGRALDLQIEVTGASRAGMRTGIAGGSNDIGSAVRAEPNSAISNDDVTWGDEGPHTGGGFNSCSSTSASCGDPNGCVAGSFKPGQLVCFAIRSCPHAGNSYPASGCSAWNTRPNSSSNAALDVLVIYRYQALTPVIAGFGAGGKFYLLGETRGVETY